MKQVQGAFPKTKAWPRAVLFGYLVALGAPLSWGTANVIAKSTVSDNDGVPPLVASAFSMGFGLLTLGLIAAGGLAKDIKAPRSAFVKAGIAGLFASSANVSLFFAFREAPLTAVVPILGTQGLFTILLSQIFIRKLDRITWRLLLGAALVVLGVAMIALSL